MLKGFLHFLSLVALFGLARNNLGSVSCFNCRFVIVHLSFSGPVLRLLCSCCEMSMWVEWCYSSAAEAAAAAKVEGVDGKFLSKIAIGNISSATFQTITIESCFKLIHILACTRLFSPPVPYSSSFAVCVGVWMNGRSLGC